MRKKLTLLGLAMALAAMVPLAFNGCASANTTAYKVQAGETASVQAAGAMWNDYVKNNHPGVAVETKVKNAFNDWKAASLLTANAGQVWAAAAADPGANPAAVQEALNAFENAVNNQHQYQMDFVNLVQQLTGKPIIR